ncbi:MAG: carbamoyltransferase HypF [Bryobacterales bacterium]|nr:carbamoyltransferase HypF [Bryobacterales bacterium]
MSSVFTVERWRFSFFGTVQGVGFRPFAFRLATELELAGWVRNSAQGAVVEVEGEAAVLAEFVRRLHAEKPRACWIAGQERSVLQPRGWTGFHIEESEAAAGKSAFLLPDLATCPECLAEIQRPGERRYGYAFTNCTNCGPRYTILTGIPYDRPQTTMAGFPLCSACEAEYRDPRDRRFHAQPVACPICGPRLDVPVADAAAALREGRIVALKGVGGFQLLCDARSAEAVARLRERKHREQKPLAVMFPSIGAVRAGAEVSAAEEVLLRGPAAPIVLLRTTAHGLLAPNVCGASPYIGAMLPYSPLHHLLLEACGFPLVATSGNRSDEPIAIDNDEAHERLAGIADVFVTHNRPIARPCDDSVVRVSDRGEIVIRRARGYAPLPVLVRDPLPRVLALGAHLKSTVAIALGRQVHLSQHIGDLETAEAFHHFQRTIADLCRLYEFEPELVACDMHPGYLSTQHAPTLGLPVVRLQHHMAHVAACAAENDVDEPYLGVAWDGTGYGTDGTIWGSEFFLVDDGDYRRVAHLRPFRLPGGESAIRDCRRTALSLLHEAGLPVEAAGLEPAQVRLLRQMLQQGVNSPITTSAGRLFDAVAALSGAATTNAFEGQAPMHLEAAILGSETADAYPHPLRNTGGTLVLDWAPMLEELLASREDAPRRFHLTLAAWITAVARELAVPRVVLSGGCFQNAWLTNAAIARLESAGHRVFTHQRVPPNDGGIALGQAVLAGAHAYL